jgi:hypothetical protein
MVLADTSSVIQWAMDAVAESRRSKMNAVPLTSEFRWRLIELESLRVLQGEAAVMKTFGDRLMAGAKTMRVPAFLDIVVQQLGGTPGPGTGGTGGNGKKTRTVSPEVARAELSRYYGMLDMTITLGAHAMQPNCPPPFVRMPGIAAI